MKALIKTPREIESMRSSGRILAEILQTLKFQLQPGITTGQVDEMASVELKKHGAQAAFLGFNGYPASICVSVNSEVVHGIPGDYIIKEGDIVGLDLGVRYEGMITDGAITVPVGEVSADAKLLLSTTEAALAAGIEQVKPGAKTGDISAAIENCLKSANLGVVKDLSGHGVGHEVHEPPEIHNEGKAGKGEVLAEGMTIAIEPMASLGKGDIRVENDGWTIKTADNSLSAQFEHTVLVTESGAEVLTSDKI